MKLLFKVALAFSISASNIREFCFCYVLANTGYCQSFSFSSVQSLSCVWLLATPWTAAHQVSLSFTISWSLLKLMSIELVTPSNCLILCRPLLLLPSVFLSIRVFSNESALCIRWPKYWRFSLSISPSSEYSEEPGKLQFARVGHVLVTKPPPPALRELQLKTCCA